MVSFSCENCNDTLAKKKLDQHRNQCGGATFTCLDCMTHFYGTDYRSHTSCISEAQKYQGHLYRDKKNRNEKRKSIAGSREGVDGTMVPRKAYVEDAPNDDDSQAIAVVDVPPRAPTPPPPQLAQSVNVFDYMVKGADGKERAQLAGRADGRRILNGPADCTNGRTEHLHPALYEHDSQQSLHTFHRKAHYDEHGFSYGASPIPAEFGQYKPLPTFVEGRPSFALLGSLADATPAPKHKQEKRDKTTSEKKRKRNQLEDLDLSLSRRAPQLKTGLTGDLRKLVTEEKFHNDRISAGKTPTSPSKRSKHDDNSKTAKNEGRKSSYVSFSTTASKAPASKPLTRSRSPERHPSRSEERRSHRSHRYDSYGSDDDYHNRPSSRQVTKAIEYTPARPASVQPHEGNQLVAYRSRADLFLSFVKGPDSLHGASVNKILKRYHRERDMHSDEREDDDKELWKSLRVRRNDRGEIVLFVED